jgi:Tfp pilus assembly protein PilN
MRSRKETAVKRLFALFVLVTLVLTGCASGKFLGFLATTNYVDASSKTLADQQAAQIEQLKGQIAANQAIVEQAKAAIDQVNKVQKTVDDLQALAKRAEDKINSIPKDVIKQIADILQAALK